MNLFTYALLSIFLDSPYKHRYRISSFTDSPCSVFRYSLDIQTTKRENLIMENRAATLMNKEQETLEAMNARTNEQGEIVVPLIAEEISIGKRTVDTGGVRVHKTVREDVQTINEPILREHIEVERVPVNKYVETAPAIRYEGEVMIVPVLEEVVVTEKRLLLREEIRLVKRREELSNVQEVTLRREEINVEEFAAENPDPELQGR
ncbi:MAG: YsnF/AvaK domain-containing protein [Pyrinomonadaceae bacterium]